MKYIIDSVGPQPDQLVNVLATGRILNDDGTPHIDVQNGNPCTFRFIGHDLDQAHLEKLIGQEIANIEGREAMISGRDACIAELTPLVGEAIEPPKPPDLSPFFAADLLLRKTQVLRSVAATDDPARIATETELDALYKAHPEYFGLA